MSPSSHRPVVISDHEYELPYSKGLMASTITATGLTPARAFQVAEAIEDRLHQLGDDRITQQELDSVAHGVIREQVGERYAATFLKWQMAKRLDKPLIVLLGGATGVGKSTIATMLAGRLGVTRVIPTDAVREVMRSMFTEELFPTLHTSSFDTSRLVRQPLATDADPLIVGFRQQVAAVAVGVQALIARAAEEGTDVIIEGAHLVPGFLDLAPLAGKAVVVPLVVTVDDEELHRSHFLARSNEGGNRPPSRYLDHFDNIRKLHRYTRSMALKHGVPVVPSYSLDATLASVIDLVVTAAVRAVPAADPSQPPPIESKRGAP